MISLIASLFIPLLTLGMFLCLVTDKIIKINNEKFISSVSLSKSSFKYVFSVFFFIAFLFQSFAIPTGSMIPTINPGQYIIASKFAYGIKLPFANFTIIEFSDPKRGDVVVFLHPDKLHTPYIKRLIGLPGDTIRFQNNELHINNIPQLITVKSITQSECGYNGEHYILGTQKLSDIPHQIQYCSQSNIKGEWVVPENHYFFVGDNRDGSSDSREWGFVHRDLIEGRAEYIWMYWPRFFSIPKISIQKVN